ncbi:MAG: hypothetical protein AAF799_01390 [Myxococcota bacterium]
MPRIPHARKIFDVRVFAVATLFLLSAACFTDAPTEPTTAGGGSTSEEDPATTTGDGATSMLPGGDSTGEACPGQVDECGVCDGPGGPCLGCTVPQASNYDPLAEVNNGTCTCEPNGNPIADQAQLERNASAGGMDEWQSFTTGLGGGLVTIEIEMSSPLGTRPSPATLSLHEGESPAGTTLGSMDITIEPTQLATMQSFEFPEPLPVAAGEVYTFHLVIPDQTIGYLSTNNADPYPGGRQGVDPGNDMVFRTQVVGCVPD